jgi:hypothetical protein
MFLILEPLAISFKLRGLFCNLTAGSSIDSSAD